ncbi:MAG: polyprenyl synthetase family protein, partial [Candidatus Eremiobacteraeota bacterium]|nr:polyprenyl synthetase family protein [Candidatus Eremiobacteraeota bacterium]
MVRYHFGYDDSMAAQKGKRLRPLLLLRVALAEGGTVEAALDAAVAVELLHNYSLVHDDIEDGDRLRHGRPTLWAHYGVPQSINAGDAMCSLSYLTLLEGMGPLGAVRARMAHALHEAHLAMCEGQSLDIGFERSDFVTMEQYRAMIAGKTAALFGAACQLGALCAGSSHERADAYAAFGRAYGIAFEIRDDVLGTWGSTAITGKPSGADIARRKWTFPVVWALGRAPSAERETVARSYGRRQPLAQEEVSAVVSALERLGARAAADSASDAGLEAAQSVAREASLDRRHTIRRF